MAQDASEIRQYDGIIIGSGQGGKPLAVALAEAGWKLALVERLHLGGTCVNVGCTPTKTMVASARLAYLARRGAEYGVNTGPIEINLAKVRERKRAIVDSFRGGSERLVQRTEGLELLRGEASFTGPYSLQVNLNDGRTVVIGARKIFINTGGRPAVPAIPGLAQIPTLDSTSIMELDAVPDHLLVLGGGYIGLEFGQMFRRFGSKVTVVHRGKHLLSREDPDVADEAASILRQDGVEILLESEPLKAEQSADGTIRLTVRTPSEDRTLNGTHLLVAVGRVPNTETLNLAAAGIERDKQGFVKVNESLETNVPGVYALGDVKGGPAFTHISYDDYRVLKNNLANGNGQRRISGRLVPYTVYIDPQLGRVGITEIEAREKGLQVRVAKIPMTYVARALETEETRGFIKAIVDLKTKLILGCAVLSIEGGEIMSILQVAMMGQLPYTALRDAVFAHPALAESLNTLFTTMDAA